MLDLRPYTPIECVLELGFGLLDHAQLSSTLVTVNPWVDMAHHHRGPRLLTGNERISGKQSIRQVVREGGRWRVRLQLDKPLRRGQGW